MGWKSLRTSTAVGVQRRDAATARQQLREYQRHYPPPPPSFPRPLPPLPSPGSARRWWLVTLAIVAFVLLTGLQIAAARFG